MPLTENDSSFYFGQFADSFYRLVQNLDEENNAVLMLTEFSVSRTTFLIGRN
ncbi:hypothetical protein SAMN04488066_10622 [Halorubrum aquaticum]|uniref:Uncharacterized protein n=1 Tax=Halorubrum aquaticum TaxID=387340 RepID=A0A1I3AIT5_9EURY|nr:hypothetical protein SAMN04488066_10622 [Halorubrum aquaticum]